MPRRKTDKYRLTFANKLAYMRQGALDAIDIGRIFEPAPLSDPPAFFGKTLELGLQNVGVAIKEAGNTKKSDPTEK